MRSGLFLFVRVPEQHGQHGSHDKGDDKTGRDQCTVQEGFSPPVNMPKLRKDGPPIAKISVKGALPAANCAADAGKQERLARGPWT